MRRLLLGIPCLAAAFLLITGGATASHDPSGEPFDEDFVVGIAEVGECSLGCSTTSLDAHSGPLGENATGTARFGLRVNQIGGPVTCLTVTCNRAVVGGQDTFFTSGGYLFSVEDNAASGTPDRFALAARLPEAPTTCPGPDDLDPTFSSVITGDLVVHNAQPPPPVVCPGAEQTLTGTKGNDEITGTALNDLILGLAGHDLLAGANGDDCVRGNAGNDTVRGGGGNDLVQGGDGSDVHQGGIGNDTLRSVDGVRDIVNCGPGDDRASVDELDQVKDCEKVTVNPRPGSG
jgi:Ca2+-binding RTX toxin-like protein